MDIEARLKMVMEWYDGGDAPDSWDNSFIESLSEQYEEKGWLSEKQEMALENIITKFDIMA